MIRLAIYISKTFIFSWLVVTFGFLILIGLLDSLANSNEIAESGRGGWATFEYMMYRAPVIFDRVLLFTVIVAMLLTYVKLIRQHELVAFIGFGFSVPKQVVILAPAVIGATTLAVLFINIAMPPSVRALQAWGVGEYKRTSISQENPLWLQDGTRIVRAAGRPNMETLTELQFFDQEETGEISIISWANQAKYDYELKIWILSGVERITSRERFTPAPFNRWASDQTPTSIAKLAADPRDLALSDMRKFRTEGNSGSKPNFAYGFWYLHRITRPLAALILLLCAIPIMQITGREDTGDKALIIGIAAGFIYLVLDGALSTFAVSGGLSIVWAVVLPLAIFGLVGSYLALKTEDLSM